MTESEPTSTHVLLGATMLALISEWNTWVSRRVDIFRFQGDDERVLTRQQSVDFKVHERLHRVRLLTEPLGGIPVPITFMNKGRLPQFSLRDESGKAMALLARSNAGPISTGMLICLGNRITTGAMLPVQQDFIPKELRACLTEIVTSERNHALQLCARFGDARASACGGSERRWREVLAGSELFMSLLYEFARGSLIFALLSPPVTAEQRIVKFSYSSYVVPATYDRVPARIGHLFRFLFQGVRDTTDSVAWGARKRSGPKDTGRIVLSTICDKVAERIRTKGLNVACALAEVESPGGGRRTMRLRPNSAVAFERVPAGRYVVRIFAVSGFQVDGPHVVEFKLAVGTTKRIAVSAEQESPAAGATLGVSLLAQPPALVRTISRGLGWHSKTLIIRVRLGDGGSYHCEFEAPEGLHITRARLFTNAPATTPGGHQRIDLVSGTVQRAHLYAGPQHSIPATGYASFNVRPRIETLVRPALLTALVAFASLPLRRRRVEDEHGV